MKKFGIITLFYKNDNYGGIAQAYALQKYIEMQGYESELILYNRTSAPVFDSYSNRCNLEYYKNKLYKFPSKLKLRIENYVASRLYKKKLEQQILLRKKAFEDSRTLAKHTKTVYDDQTISNTVDLFHCFISGSDQIWKPIVVRPAYVCNFLPDSKPRFSYASSISVKGLSEEYDKYMKEALKKFSWISVREKEAKNHLQNILSREVDVVVDPTLLLPISEWVSISSKNLINEKYIFVYLLGQSKRQREKIKEYAENKHLKIVTLPHIEGKVRACDLNFGDICLYDVTLQDFLSLIKFSNTVITDSYHAVIFSIIFKKQFLIFERESFQRNGGITSRIYTLLSMTGLGDRLVKNDNINKINIDKINYDLVLRKLEKHIIKSKKLLNHMLDDI